MNAECVCSHHLSQLKCCFGVQFQFILSTGEVASERKPLDKVCISVHIGSYSEFERIYKLFLDLLVNWTGWQYIVIAIDC